MTEAFYVISLLLHIGLLHAIRKPLYHWSCCYESINHMYSAISYAGWLKNGTHL